MNPESDPMLAFASEEDIASGRVLPGRRPPLHNRQQPWGALIAALVLAGVGAGAYWLYGRAPAAVTTGSLAIHSEPPGAEVVIDGTVRGQTPLTLRLAPGQYGLTVRGRGGSKDISVAVTAGEQAVHHISWASASTAEVAAPTGGLSVTTDTPGSVVRVDGVARGNTPLTLTGLSPGPHEVVVQTGTVTHRRSVRVEPGVTTSLVLSAPAGPSAGWLSVAAPVSLQVREKGQVVGSTDVARMMLPAGDHDLEFASDVIGFSVRRRVQVTAGQTMSLDLAIPPATMNINAIPWAEVFIGNRRLGETPLANVSLPPGSHELIFRHPQFGERRVTAVATLRETARIAVDMRNR